MHSLDYGVILAYLLFSIGLGIYFGRNQSRQEFFAAGNSMGWLPVGLSVMATLFSANSFVMYPSIAYGSGLRISLFLIAISLMAPLVLWVFIPVYARLKCQTAYEYLERRYHVSVRSLASGLFIFLRIGWMASATYAASVVLANVMQVDQVTVIVVLGVVSIFYTMLGGLRAVMWTDVLQFFIFSLTILLTLGLILNQTEGGVSGMWSTYFEGRDNVLIDFTPSMTLEYGSWALLIGLFLEGLSAFGADQVAVQRYISARSEKTSQIGFSINILGMWIVVPGLLAIGVGLYSHYQQFPEEIVSVLTTELNGELPDWRSGDGMTIPEYYASYPQYVAEDIRALNKQDEALPQYVRLHFPPGVVGLFLVALMAAVMSSIDSGIHSVTTALMVDFRDRHFAHWKPENNMIEMLQDRALVVLIGILSIFLACNVGEMGDVFAIGKKMTAGFGGPLLAVFILALFCKNSTTVGVMTGALSGALITISLMYLAADWFSVWFWPIGFGLTMLIGLVVSLLTAKTMPHAGEESLTYWNVIHGNFKNPQDNGE
ncbi:sodium:solute symporter family transporter [Gimesia maris]|uniref:sodium:solute symporter family transporter n=1 Tax=Gimesia maris TaxID=122 RepID=UPI00241D163D|nr:sodium/solute symporter [Gimesia maris]|tara:strand:- start:166269 stop:167900 length:1632 start_codon:yes stop_codon:yes gene_type:complete